MKEENSKYKKEVLDRIFGQGHLGQVKRGSVVRGETVSLNYLYAWALFSSAGKAACDLITVFVCLRVLSGV